MKRFGALVIAAVLALCIGMTAGTAESILPGYTQLFGAEMPSLGSVLGRQPDDVSEGANGLTETYNNVTPADFEAFGVYMGEQGCVMASYEMKGKEFTSVITRGDASFTFSYDAVTGVARLTYPAGTYPETGDLPVETAAAVEVPADESILARFNGLSWDDDLDTVDRKLIGLGCERFSNWVQGNYEAYGFQRQTYGYSGGTAQFLGGTPRGFWPIFDVRNDRLFDLTIEYRAEEVPFDTVFENLTALYGSDYAAGTFTYSSGSATMPAWIWTLSDGIVGVYNSSGAAVVHYIRNGYTVGFSID